MFKNILVPIDIGDESSWKTAMPVVLEYARAFKSKVHVMTVVSTYGMVLVEQYFPKGSVEEVLTKSKQDLHQFVKTHVPEDVSVEESVVTGVVYECIIEAAKHLNADLVIMTAGRPDLKDYLLGPNAAKVVRHSDRSVLVVREKKKK